MTNRSKILLSVAAAILLGACGTTRIQKQKATKAATAQIGMAGLVADINRHVQNTARQITANTEDREVKRVMIRWQMGTMEGCLRALQLPDPRWSFVNLWTMIYQTKKLASSGRVEELNAEQLKRIDTALDELQGMLKARALTVLTRKQLDDVTAAVKAWADKNPYTDTSMSGITGPTDFDDDNLVENALLAVPDSVFSLGGGVKDTAHGISDVADAANRAGSVVESLPWSVRWQTELLIYNIEEYQSTKQLLRNLDEISRSIATVSARVDSLPADIEHAVTKAAKDVERMQPELRATLKEGRGIVDEARGAIQETNTALDKVQETGVWVEKTAAHATEAGKAWEGAVEQVNLLVAQFDEPDDAPPTEPSPPFDMKDLARTAEEAAKTAEGLRASVVELRAIVEGDGIDQRLEQINTTTQSTLDQTTGAANTLINTITLRGAMLIVLFFLSLFGYRVAASQLIKNRS